MKSLLLLTGFFAILLMIYGVLLFRARYRRLKRIAESTEVEVLAATLIAEEEGSKYEVRSTKGKSC
jgi:hypothetical protein